MPSDPPRWIIVPHWDEFQHPDALRSSSPPWIKTWTRLLSDDDYRRLTSAQRGVLHGVWVEYARSHRRLTDDTAALTRRLGCRVTDAQLNALSDAGFIELSASRPASNYASKPASPEERRREEKRSKGNDASKNGARAWSSEADVERLDFSFPGGPVLADACPECGVGGGQHTADCLRSVLG